MKRPKLIALDMDGTMLDDEGRLSLRTKAALQAAQKAGIHVVIATGRMYPSAMIHIKEIGIKSASIFYNGALIRDTESGRTIYERTLGSQLSAEILSFFRKKGWYIQMYTDDQLLVADDSDERCKYYESICGLKAVALGEKFWSVGGDTAKLLGIALDPEIYAKMCETVEREFGSRIFVTSSWNAFIEILHPSVNKASALCRVCELYGVAREDVIAIGDGGNDVEMVRWAGIGVAMANARTEVKGVADIIAPSNNEDGAAQIIEKILVAD